MFDVRRVRRRQRQACAPQAATRAIVHVSAREPRITPATNTRGQFSPDRHQSFSPTKSARSALQVRLPGSSRHSPSVFLPKSKRQQRVCARSNSCERQPQFILPYHSTLHVQQEGYHASPLALRALQFREPASQICLPNFCPHGIRGSVVQFFSPTSSGEGMCSRRRHAASESLSQSMPPNAPVQVLKLTRVCN